MLGRPQPIQYDYKTAPQACIRQSKIIEKNCQIHHSMLHLNKYPLYFCCFYLKIFIWRTMVCTLTFLVHPSQLEPKYNRGFVTGLRYTYSLSIYLIHSVIPVQIWCKIGKYHHQNFVLYIPLNQRYFMS